MLGNMTVERELEDSKENIYSKNLFHFLPYQPKGYFCCIQFKLCHIII